MEMGPGREMADRPQAVDEPVESRWRPMLASREFVRRNEERRHLALGLEQREAPRRPDGSPRGGLKLADDRGVPEGTEPQWTDCVSGGCRCRDKVTGFAAGNEAKRSRGRGRARRNHDKGPKEMFRGERQDWSDPQASLLRDPRTVAEQDSKANLRALRRTKRTGTVPFLTGPRIGST